MSQGDVANEVETEQIVLDSSASLLRAGGCGGQGRATSFVQMRGSVPGLWGQEMTNMMPKPQIFRKGKDAFCLIAGEKKKT